ncbi:MAG: SDR family oxidoreductase [Acidobacteria bacterium]|nr:SDR family oxidoreductase [Acidobacteriota bacterium]
MAQKLKGKVAIVTGAGRGIGRSIAEAYAAEGATVVVTAARELAEIQEVAMHTGALAIQADVTRAEEVAKVVETARSRFGRIDILVNNAARGMKYVNERFLVDPLPFWQCDPQVWEMMIDTNINGVFLMTRAVVPHLLQQGWGRIINISINLETMQRKGFSPYGPSKAALEAMSAAWAKELEGTGVTVNVLLPGGATRTGMIPPEVPESLQRSLLDPQVMAPAAVHLASEEADRLTGQRIVAVEWNRAYGL